MQFMNSTVINKLLLISYTLKAKGPHGFHEVLFTLWSAGTLIFIFLFIGIGQNVSLTVSQRR